MIQQNTKVVFNKGLGPDTFLMGLRSPQIVAEARPGQFVMIRVHPGMDPLLRRPFSVCGTEGNQVFLILYRIVGRGTAIMSRVREGERLTVLGPLGKGFDLPKAEHNPVLVAGGIGIAPLIFLAQTIERRDMTFMAGYPSENEILPMVQVGLSGTEISIATDDGTAGHRGPVTELLETRLAGLGEGLPAVFTCGPLQMMKRVALLTLDRGIPCQVSLETHMACGLGACQGCVVKSSSRENLAYRHVCQDGPVFRAQGVDWESL